MFDKGMLALTLAVIAQATSGVADDPAPLPECWMTDVPEFLTILKTHIKSTNKEGSLECNIDGFVDEICKHSSSFDPGDTDVTITWNECGIISFTCSNVNVDFTYTPGPLPAEVTDQDLNNGHIIGTCMSNTVVYIIAIAIVLAVLIFAIAICYCCFCRKKTSEERNRSGQEAGEELVPINTRHLTT